MKLFHHEGDAGEGDAGEGEHSRRREQLTVVLGVVGTLLAYLAWRATRSKSSSSSGGYGYPTGSSSAGYSPLGAGAGGGGNVAGLSDAVAQLGAQQTALAGALAGLLNGPGAGATSQTTQPTAGSTDQRVFYPKPVTVPGDVTPPANQHPVLVGSTYPGVGLVEQITQISNPPGSAAADAAQPQNRYTPSPLDLATELPGGLTQILAATPGGPSNGVYTVYPTFSGGSGAVVPVDQRIPGERYDAAGRVIF